MASKRERLEQALSTAWDNHYQHTPVSRPVIVAMADGLLEEGVILPPLHHEHRLTISHRADPSQCVGYCRDPECDYTVGGD